MTKKGRHSLTDLLSQFSVDDLSEETTPKQSAAKKSQQQPQTNLLDKLKEQQPDKTTRITLDLDTETYEQLAALVEYTGLTKAKLLRALIRETANLLQKSSK